MNNARTSRTKRIEARCGKCIEPTLRISMEHESDYKAAWEKYHACYAKWEKCLESYSEDWVDDKKNMGSKEDNYFMNKYKNNSIKNKYNLNNTTKKNEDYINKQNKYNNFNDYKAGGRSRKSRKTRRSTRR
jgi:hypothetical protein